MALSAKEKRILFIQNAIEVLGRELNAIPDSQRDDRWFERDRDRARLQDRLAGLMGVEVNRPKSPGEEFALQAKIDRERERLDERFKASVKTAKSVARQVRVSLRAAKSDTESRSTKAVPSAPPQAPPPLVAIRPAPRDLEPKAKAGGEQGISDDSDRSELGRIYHLEEAAQRCGVSKGTMLVWIEQRGLRALALGNPKRYRARDYIIRERWIAEFMERESGVRFRFEPEKSTTAPKPVNGTGHRGNATGYRRVGSLGPRPR